jgi:hypothetical protein
MGADMHLRRVEVTARSSVDAVRRDQLAVELEGYAGE